ncbi:MAG: hypothetical protein WC058_04115, partial [Phycisphaeraceae bacterium]
MTVAIRIGADWWRHLGGDHGLVEICVAMIRACVAPGDSDKPNHSYVISDLAQIVSMSTVSADFNTSILQRSQLPWLFFLARHFRDDCRNSSRNVPCLDSVEVSRVVVRRDRRSGGKGAARSRSGAGP